MNRLGKIGSSLILFLSVIFAGNSRAACLPDGVQSSGAKYRICMPETGSWNGNLILYAHGYVAFNQPVAIPENQLTLPDGISIPSIVNDLGFGFGVTSYSVNGLAIKEGVQDLLDLVQIFKKNVGNPQKVYVIGPSEGGLVTALSIEQHPETYNGGVATCGPIGNFREQINYLGDFRVLFDYFFPGVIPGDVIQIPEEVIDNWEAVYVPKIKKAIKDNPSATQQLLNVSHAPVDPAVPTTIQDTVIDVLWYSVFSTNDATLKLGGQPYENRYKLYFGSNNDFALNIFVKRYSAEKAALDEIGAYYETTGKLFRPLVTMHTTGDPIVPYWHEPIYRFKAFVSGSWIYHSNLPVLRYGHCNFNVVEAILALGGLLIKDAILVPPTVTNLIPAEKRGEFVSQAKEAGLLK